MGVGIVAGLTASSPVSFPSQHLISSVLFCLLNGVFGIALVLWITRWVIHRDAAIADFHHPSRVLFYGALAMGINVVGNDYLIIGTHLLPPSFALTVSKTLWIIGAGVSTFTVIIVPFLLFTLHEVRQEETLANWLIPVVPPIVAAALGMNLLPYWQSSIAETMATVLVAMFGMTFFLFIMVSVLVYARLVYHPRLTGETSPTLWIEIGPIGMSMATLSSFGPDASQLLHLSNTLFLATGIFAAIAMWGVGLWWIAISLLHTLLHMTGKREGLSFHLGWWSYVFPIGSFTTGTYALARSMHSPFFTGASFIEFTAVWIFFAIVFLRTAAGIASGRLLSPPGQSTTSLAFWRPKQQDVDLPLSQ